MARKPTHTAVTAKKLQSLMGLKHTQAVRLVQSVQMAGRSIAEVGDRVLGIRDTDGATRYVDLDAVHRVVAGTQTVPQVLAERAEREEADRLYVGRTAPEPTGPHEPLQVAAGRPGIGVPLAVLAHRGQVYRDALKAHGDEVAAQALAVAGAPLALEGRRHAMLLAEDPEHALDLTGATFVPLDEVGQFEHELGTLVVFDVAPEEDARPMMASPDMARELVGAASDDEGPAVFDPMAWALGRGGMNPAPARETILEIRDDQLVRIHDAWRRGNGSMPTEQVQVNEEAGEHYLSGRQALVDAVGSLEALLYIARDRHLEVISTAVRQRLEASHPAGVTTYGIISAAQWHHLATWGSKHLSPQQLTALTAPWEAGW